MMNATRRAIPMTTISTTPRPVLRTWTIPATPAISVTPMNIGIICCADVSGKGFQSDRVFSVAVYGSYNIVVKYHRPSKDMVSWLRG